MLAKAVSLNCGSFMPVVGFGTFQIKDAQDMMQSLDCALGQGYRLLDTAAVYKNEKAIGACLPRLLQKHGLKRGDIFVTTKLGPCDLDGEKAQDAVMTSLKNLGMEYIDLYLIHWPAKQGLKKEDSQNAELRKDCWTVLEEMHKNTEYLRAIGVSNYTLRHMEELLSYCYVKPAVLQSEFHPDFQQKDVLKFCSEHGIHFQAYSSLGCGKLVSENRFRPIADQYSKTIPQVLLRWAVQKGCSIIPKSTNPTRIAENFNVFDFTLSDDAMQAIDKTGRQIKYAWDSTSVA